MKTIAFIDTNHGRGHHLTYMRGFCKTMLEAGYRVFCFYPEPEAVREWLAEVCTASLDNFHPVTMPELKRHQIPIFGKLPANFPVLGRVPQPISVLARWNYAAEKVKAASQNVGVEPDLVFFNWLDNYFSYYLNGAIVDRIFPYPWSGLYFRPGLLRFGERKLPLFGTPLNHWSVAEAERCQSLTLLDEYVVEDLKDKLDKPVLAFPDLTDETPPDPNYELARKIREKANGRKIIGTVGSLSKRKGLLTLIEIANRSKDKDWLFIFAGRLSMEMFNQDFDSDFTDEYLTVKKLAEDPPENCFCYFDSIPDGAAFNAVIDACDVLFSAYENFKYSSNVLTKSAVMKKPLIVSDGYCMEKRVKQFGMGLSVPEGDVDRCIEALDRLLDPESPISLPSDFESYRNLHSHARLEALLKTVLGDEELPPLTPSVAIPERAKH